MHARLAALSSPALGTRLCLCLCLCLCLLVASSHAETIVFDHPDPANDMGWDPPKNALFTTGVFDIRHFTVSYDQHSVYLNLTFAGVSNPFFGLFGFSHQMCQFFIDTDRMYDSGSLDPLNFMFNARGAISPMVPYEWAFYFTGWSAEAFSVKDNLVNTTMRYTVDMTLTGTTISSALPISLIGTPKESWAYTVWCGSENFGKYRDVLFQTGDFTFGGGVDEDIELRAADFLAPANYDKRATFDAYKQNKPSIVPPVGVGILFRRVYFSISDPAGDQRALLASHYQQIPSQLDLQYFEFAAVGDKFAFLLKFESDWKDSTDNLPLRSIVTQIYVDMDSRIKTGSRTGIKNADFSFADDRAWEFVISASNHSVTLTTFKDGSFTERDIPMTEVSGSASVLEVLLLDQYLTELVPQMDPTLWTFTIVTGLASSDGNFIELCPDQSVCGLAQKNPRSSNIVDLIDPINLSQAKILNVYVKPGSQLSVPFLNQLKSVMLPLIDLPDEVGDELMVYPTTFHGVPINQTKGLYDIINFQASQDGFNLRITITLNSVTLNQGLQPIFVIYVDQDNIAWSGRTTSLASTGISINPASSWEYAIVVDMSQETARVVVENQSTTKSVAARYDGNSITMLVPLNALASNHPVQGWSYGICVGVHSDNNQFQSLATQPTDGAFSRTIPDINYNFADFVVKGTNQQYVVEGWKYNADLASLPFFGSATTLMWNDGIYEDVLHDESRAYPSNPYFLDKRELFDLAKFMVQHNTTDVRLTTSMSNILPQEKEGLPLGYLGVQIYVDTDRVWGSGCLESVGKSNIHSQPQYAWEYAFFVSGSSTTMYKCAVNTTVEQVGVFGITVQKSVLYFELPISLMGSINQEWNYVVVSGAVLDQKSPVFLTVAKFSSSTTFGGGDTYGLGPNVIDFLAESRTPQKYILDTYDVARKSTLPPIGRNINAGSLVWGLPDNQNDEYASYPSAISSLWTKRLFDILVFTAETDAENMYLRCVLPNIIRGATQESFLHLLLNIYVDMDGLAGSGSKNGVSNANIKMSETLGWEFAVVASPHGCQLHLFDRELETARMLSLEKCGIADGNSVVVTIPIIHLEQLRLSSNSSFVVATGMESSTPWQFVPLGAQSSSPNVFDVALHSFMDQTKILSSHSETPQTLVTLPFVGARDILPLYSIEDAVGDEFGLYLVDANLGGSQPSGHFDIRKFEVQNTGSYLQLTVSFARPLINPKEFPYGFTYPIVSIYVHERTGPTGRFASMDRSFVDLESAWRCAIAVSGQATQFHYGPSLATLQPSESDVSASISRSYNPTTSSIIIQIPIRSIGIPTSDWSYTVVSGHYDDTGRDFSIRNKVPSTRFLGGGDDDFYDPNIIDVVLPIFEDATGSMNKMDFAKEVQDYILSNYNVEKQIRTIIPSLGPTRTPLLERWYIPATPAPSLLQSGEDEDPSWIIVVAVVVPVVTLTFAFAIVYHKQAKSRLSDLGWNVDYKELNLLNVIGSGGYGEVHRAEWRDSVVAVKVLLDKQLNKSKIAEFQRELAIMCELRHPCLCMFMGGCANPPNLFIISEYMDRGSLSDILADEAIPIAMSLRYMFASDCAKGLSFLHNHDPPIIHADLKSPNILVDQKWQVKISDFGLSKIKGKTQGDKNVMSLMWAAPEVLKGQEPNEKSDVYSYAIIVWEIFSREMLYAQVDSSSLPLRVVDGLRPTINDFILQAEGIKEIITSGWVGDPLKRPTISALRKPLVVHSSPSNYDSVPGFSNYSSTATTERPKDSAIFKSGTKVLVCCDLHMSASIWEEHPDDMYKALQLYSSLLRSSMQKYDATQLKVDSDHFMLLFPSSNAALDWALKFQEAMLEISWPTKLVEENRHCGMQFCSSRTMLFKGPRARISIHCGEAEAREHPTTGQIMVIGPAVARVKAICNIASGGQVLLTEEAFIAAQFDQQVLPEHKVKEIPYHDDADGMHESKLFQVLPPKLAARQFPDLKSSGSHGTPMPGSAQSTETASHEQQQELIRPSFHIDYDTITTTKVLGTGSFGQVLLGTYKGTQVAVKKLLRQKMNQKGISDFRREVLVMKNLDHPNILKMVGICVQQPNLCIVLEYMSNGSVEDLLKNKEFNWTNEVRQQMLRDAANGVKYLHDLHPRIVHRDLKSANLLVGDGYTVKVSDFGVSRIQSTQNTMTKCGTPAWAAPEVLRGDRYDEKVDVYSFGIIMWEMFSRRLPYADLRSSPAVITGEIASGRLRPPVSFRSPQGYEVLMTSCWAQESADRPNIDAVLQTISNPKTWQ